MPLVVSIVGKSGSGKTTFLEKLIRELTSRGYRVATIKHTHHSLTLDQPNKDSWRHVRAGSEVAILSSPGEIAMIKPVSSEPTVGEIARLLGEDYDIILTEGFSRGDAPKIEVHRKEVGLPLKSAKQLVAIATDEPLDTKVRQFSLEDIKSVADLLEKDFIEPQEERLSIYVNGAFVPLIVFPKQIISNVLLAIASSLKGVGEVRSLQFFLKKGTRRKD